MKNVFRYTPPGLLNNAYYAVVLTVVLAALHFEGQRLFDAVHARMADFALFVGCGFALYLFVFWSWGLFYILLDKYQRPAFLYRYRVQVPAPGQAQSSSATTGRRSAQPSTGDAVRLVLFNQFCGTLPVLVSVFFLLRSVGAFASQEIPSTGTILLKLSGMVLVEEILFFTAHYLLHTRPLFRRFHHIHHRFRQPIGISTHYVHFVEHLVGNLLPIFTAMLVVRADFVSGFLWVGFAVTNAIHTHSDYAFPLMVSPLHHDFHHYLARGNYGVLGLLDRLFGTDREYRALAQQAPAGIPDAETSGIPSGDP
jgi:methylsterol monooxygenase